MNTPVLSIQKHKYTTLKQDQGDQLDIHEIGPMTIAGSFKISQALADEYGLKRLHKGLILCLTSDFYHSSHNLIGNALTYPDDLEKIDDSYIGYFAFKLDTLTNMNLKGKAYITVSLLGIISNTLEIEIPDV
jgi:hypothetical protein